MWALPSGYVEINMTPQENAIAEMQEETGLIGEVEHCIDWFYGYSPIYLRTLSIGFKMKVMGGKLQAGDDAEEARFFALDEFPPWPLMPTGTSSSWKPVLMHHKIRRIS